MFESPNFTGIVGVNRQVSPPLFRKFWSPGGEARWRSFTHNTDQSEGTFVVFLSVSQRIGAVQKVS